MLRSFAVSARVSLLRDVSARLVGVLAPGSAERVEVPGVVAALEAAIAGAGGGDAGRAVVVDRVAYTWFNRIVALRFMDANGFTGVGVVSPQLGQQIGQPEVLADAKAGQIDPEVVSVKGRELVEALLNGSRRSSDAQGEAYGVLLAEYCRHWNRVMPFMFERAGDFTELLIPANLLAPDSLLVKANEVMTAEVCADVEVIGWLYQFYISERKDEVFAGFKKGKKAGAKEIPAATQLFTPDWIVRYLVENSLGRLWLLNNPQSKLAEQMDYYITPVDEETDFLKITSPEELKIMDPACGSGHMLTYAFDLLYAIYEEAGYAPADIPGLILSKNLFGVEIDQRAGSLAAFALVMKARARQRTFFNKDIQPNICVLQNVHFTPDELDELITSGGDRFAEEDFWQAFEHADTFGSLIQPDETLLPSLRMHVDHVTRTDQLFTQDLYNRADTILTQVEYLSKRHHVIVANPPYMGSGRMIQELAHHLSQQFPDAKQDMYGAFVLRAYTLTLSTGLIAMITGDTWMTIKSFERFRETILKSGGVLSFLHLDDVSNHPDIFGANAAFVLERDGGRDLITPFVRLQSLNSDNKRIELLEAIRNDADADVYLVRVSDFQSVSGAPFTYQMSKEVRRIFRSYSELETVADAKQGLATANDGRFLRLWFEISNSRIGQAMPDRESAKASKCKWFPFNKGGSFRRWYGNILHVINWENDGVEIRSFGTHDGGRTRSRPQNTDYYFMPAVSWSNVSSGAPAFRHVDEGVIFGHVGQSIFGTPEIRAMLLATLNSSYGHYVLSQISPSLHFNSGTIASVPVAPNLTSRCGELVDEMVEISRLDWDSQEISLGFSAPDWSDRDLLLGLSGILNSRFNVWADRVGRMAELEAENSSLVLEAFDLSPEFVSSESGRGISLLNNPYFTSSDIHSEEVARSSFVRASMENLISFSIGCMFGRYSLDAPGLILANQGDTLQEYLARIPIPSFTPDVDNVIPIVDGAWFEDDIVARFREFLRVAFGKEHFEENLRFVTETLGVKDLRDYFVKSFYKDHVQRYKKRPIYWLFSSPKGSFNALIYMHRYNPSTVSTVLNEYLREYNAKLSASLQHHERLAVGAGSAKEQAVAAKEADRLRKVILELDEYEHDVLYPLASQQIAIDLDDGVKANYPKFGAALKKIPGLEASDE